MTATFKFCPKGCGRKLRVWHEPDGPDDYVKKGKCISCGMEFSE